CWHCHNQLNVGVSPAISPGWGHWGFYQGQTNYTGSSHGSSSSLAYPGPQSGTDSSTEPSPIWPRSNRSSLPAGNQRSCVNCHTPHGIKGQTNYLGDDLTPTTTNYGVASITSDLIISRQLIAWEEALCLRCHDHDTAGPATGGNIKAQVDMWGFLSPTQWNTTEGSGHPVREDTYFGNHDLLNESTYSSPAVS
ncbi:MAG: hypothetical protein ACYSTI_13595, partial [Planctomycetota bacterium]